MTGSELIQSATYAELQNLVSSMWQDQPDAREYIYTYLTDKDA